MKFSTPANRWHALPPELDVFNATHWDAFVQSKVDPRTVGWPLMDNFSHVALICLAYVALIVAGPAVFGRLLPGPVNVKPLMIAYNVAVIALNAALFCGFVFVVVTRRYNVLCNVVDYSDDLALRLVYWYFVSKGVDFTDTVFMLLRKKFDQASFLHVYHHCSMFLIWYVGARFLGGGASVTGPMINCFVHVIMYSYYLAIAVGVNVPAHWKKRITQLQIAQLVGVTIHSVVVAERGCDFPSALLYAQAAFLTSLAVLFIRFYIRAYHSGRAGRLAAGKDE
jgi:elongation of very long chain fatty acids protein 4